MGAMRGRGVAVAMAVAATRAGLGLAALAWPSEVARPWVGAAAGGPAGQVLGRALGGRDIALGLGAVVALRRSAGGPQARAWVTAGAVSDTLDTVATVSAWRSLPRAGRLMVVAASAGAALAGAAGALAMPSAPAGRRARRDVHRSPRS